MPSMCAADARSVCDS